MEKKVLFNDYQEQTAQDHTDVQDFAQTSFDHLVYDAVTKSRRYSGFNVVKTAQAEVQVAVGRMYDTNGAVYVLDSVTTQTLTAKLAGTAKRYVQLCVTGVVADSDQEERDYITDVDNDIIEPKPVNTVRYRNAVLSWNDGTESADPVPPTTPVGYVAIANILLDTVQVVSVTMLTDNQVASTEGLDDRVDDLEIFESTVGPTLASLASDIAALRAALAALAPWPNVQRIAEDVARVKDKLRYPATASDYGADDFLDTDQSDTANALGFGYDAKVEEGIRFDNADEDEFAIDLFSGNDANAKITNGYLLPKWTAAVKLATSYATSITKEISLGTYGYQTLETKTGYMSRSRLRYGSSFWCCINHDWYDATPGSTSSLANLYFGTELEMVVVGAVYQDNTSTSVRYDTYFYDTWYEPYIYSIAVDNSITGALLAQSFLNANDMWCPQVSIYVIAKAAEEAIIIALCELTAGMPDLDKCMQYFTLAAADIKVGWNDVACTPTFLRKGTRYGFIVMSNANHKLGMVEGQQYIDGTFFRSTDTETFVPDLTQDLAFKLWSCRFDNSQVSIEFEAIHLDGGFRYVDILAEMWVPESCQLVWEVLPSGGTTWVPLVRDNATTLFGQATAPSMCRFRGTFVGTSDVHACIHICVNSRVHVSRPNLTFKHVSTALDLNTASDEIHVKCLLQAFDDTPHDHTCALKTGAGLGTDETPDTTTTKLINAEQKLYEREYTFILGGGNISHFCIIQNGTTNTEQNTYLVAERTYYAA